MEMLFPYQYSHLDEVYLKGDASKNKLTKGKNITRVNQNEFLRKGSK